MRLALFVLCLCATLQGLTSSKCPPITVRKDTIIRTKQSIQNGAKLLFRTDVGSSRECYELCCDRKACNVGVMHYKRRKNFNGRIETQKTCFIFACGTPNHCSFMNHTGYAVIEMVSAKTTQKPHRTFPKEEICPPGMPVAMCSNDPCENAVCHGHEHAACVQNYCGGCSAVFYDSYGRKLHCNGKSQPTLEHNKSKVKLSIEKEKEEEKDEKEEPNNSEEPEGNEVDKENGEGSDIVNEEEVDVGPEDTSGKPTEGPFVPNEQTEDDPHRVKQWRTWLDAKKTLESSAKPPTVTTVYNGETEEPELPMITKKTDQKVILKKESPISLSLLIALSICIIILVAVIVKLKCLGPKKKKKFAVDDGDYLINGMYL